MDWKIIITKVSNGYICEWYEEVDDNDFRKRHHVIEELDCEHCELQAMESLLYFIKEHFGVYYNKHSKFNLYVDVKEEITD